MALKNNPKLNRGVIMIMAFIGLLGLGHYLFWPKDYFDTTFSIGLGLEVQFLAFQLFIFSSSFIAGISALVYIFLLFKKSKLSTYLLWAQFGLLLFNFIPNSLSLYLMSWLFLVANIIYAFRYRKGKGINTAILDEPIK